MTRLGHIRTDIEPGVAIGPRTRFRCGPKSKSKSKSTKKAPTRLKEKSMDDDKEKSLFDSFADTIKHTFDIATEAASKALEPEPLKPDEEIVIVPTSPDSFVSDPAPPIVAIVKKKSRKKTGVDTSGRITPNYDFPVSETPMRSPRKAAKKVSKKPVRKSVRKTAKKVARRSKMATKKSITKKTKKTQRRSGVGKKTKKAKGS
jgi:hypothetical protein